MTSDRSVRLSLGIRIWTTTLIGLFVAGCGTSEFPETYLVSGTVLLPDGKPLQGGKIEFELVSDTNIRAMGDINPDGTIANVFTYKSNGRETEGLVAGEHRVRFELPPGNDEPGNASQRTQPLIDPRYSSFDTSNLTLTIPTQDKLTIQLKKAN